MKKALFISILALLVAVAALVKDYLPCAQKASVATAPAVAEGSFNLEAALQEHPEYVVGALRAYETKMREEAEAHTRALIKDSTEELQADNTAFQGPADAEIVMVEFYDYACGYCRRLFPDLNQIIAKNSDIKVLFRPVAFVSPHSEYAARATLAANLQGKFVELHTALMTVQKPLSEELVDELAGKAGVDIAKMKEDMKSEAISNTFNGNSELMQKLEIHGVPTLIMNGEMIEPFSQQIQAKINEAKGVEETK